MEDSAEEDGEEEDEGEEEEELEEEEDEEVEVEAEEDEEVEQQEEDTESLEPLVSEVVAPDDGTVGSLEVQAHGLCRVRRAARVGQREGVPVGLPDMSVGRRGWAPGGTEVGEGARLPVERVDVLVCR